MRQLRVSVGQCLWKHSIKFLGWKNVLSHIIKHSSQNLMCLPLGRQSNTIDRNCQVHFCDWLKVVLKIEWGSVDNRHSDTMSTKRSRKRSYCCDWYEAQSRLDGHQLRVDIGHRLARSFKVTPTAPMGGGTQLFEGAHLTGGIWVSFCRTGKMSVLCPFFLKSRASVWPNLIR